MSERESLAELVAVVDSAVEGEGQHVGGVVGPHVLPVQLGHRVGIDEDQVEPARRVVVTLQLQLQRGTGDLLPADQVDALVGGLVVGLDLQAAEPAHGRDRRWAS